MSTSSVLLVLGDEHVHPVSSVWSEPSSDNAPTRTTPCRCSNRTDAMDRASHIAESATSTRDYPWIRDDNGLVISPAYLRGYAKAMRF